jgi:hypothetical protein
VSDRLAIEPDIIVQLDVKTAQGVGCWCTVLVEVSQIRSVDGVTGQETRWQGRDTAGVEFKDG